MKKNVLCLFLASLLPLLGGCAPTSYDDRLSEVRCDLFLAETEAFSLTLSCVAREYPYADDGVPCPMRNAVEVVLTPAEACSGEVSVTGEGWGGEASFSAAYGDYRFSQGVEHFPTGSVSLHIVWGEATYDVTATSVRTEETLSPAEALAIAARAEEETIERMRREGTFCGEFRVRLLRREQNYYFVGITDGREHVALLLDAASGEVLARRTQ